MTHADGYAEREAANVMINGAGQVNPEGALTLGADKGTAWLSSLKPCRR